MRKPKAFTLIELLVVVAIIALLISILLPSLSRARELSKRTVCMANQRGIGQAFYIYAQDDPGTFPAISVAAGAEDSAASEGQMQIFFETDRTSAPATLGIPSPTVDMWTIVRANNTTPKQYICPSSPDIQDPAQDTSVYFDFSGPGNLSYAYQYQHDLNRRVVGTSSEPTFPVLADGNPYIKGGYSGSSPTLLNDRNSAARGNSSNHTNREGQNILFQDGHVSFDKGPDAGLSGRIAGATHSRGKDNIYSTHTFNQPVDPGTNKPKATPRAQDGECNLGGKSDACLVP